MITSRPRCSAVEAYSAMRCGVRCAETILVSCSTPNRVRISLPCRIFSQSDLLPMMTPASGRDSILLTLRECVPGLPVLVTKVHGHRDLQAKTRNAIDQRVHLFGRRRRALEPASEI